MFIGSWSLQKDVKSTLEYGLRAVLYVYFWEVADVGECNYADYLVSRVKVQLTLGWFW